MPVTVDRRRARAAVAVAVVTLLAAGCTGDVIAGRGTPAAGTASSSGSSPAPPAVPTGELTWGETANEVTNLMPLVLAGSTSANANLTVRVLDGLFRMTPQVEWTPDPDQGTASSDVVGGQQVVDITINPDAVWADGAPVTADDYAFTINAQRSTEPAQGGCAALLSTAGFNQVERTEKVGAKQLKVYFKTPYADWKAMFGGAAIGAPLLSKHVLDKGSPAATCAAITAGWTPVEGIPLGAQNGPWLLTGDNYDETAKTFTLVPNPRYRGDKPKLAKLIYRTLETSDDAVRALRDGTVDVVYPSAQDDVRTQLRQVTGAETTSSSGSSFEHLDFNTGDPLLKYPQIRQAIALSIDRDPLVRQVAGAFVPDAKPLGNRLLLEDQQGYSDNSGPYATRNVARAKQLIESVGGRLGSDGVYTLGGARLSFRVMTTPNNPARDRTISIMASQVRAAGIQLTGLPNPDIFGQSGQASSLAAFGYQLALFAWVNSPALSASNSIYYTAGRAGASSQNWTRGGSRQLDTVLDTVATSTSSSAQIAALNAADRLMWTQLATLPLYQKPTLLAYRNTVSGLRDNVSLAGPLWNSDEISVK